jgi:prepilin-type N-terminal cleavage/methylation domain-containing protein/prepilin-type processing-associated H-X9-DG protein
MFHPKGEPAMTMPVPSHPASPSPKAFTIVEVLVVISIITVLMSILIPALSRGRSQAQQLLCAANLRQTAVLSFVYAQENQYYLSHATNYPTHTAANSAVPKDHKTWSQVIDLTDPSTRLRRCPGTANIQFSWTTKSFIQGPAAEIQSLRYHAPSATMFTRSDQFAAYPYKKLTSIKKNLDKLQLATDLGGSDGNATQRFGGGFITAEGPRFRHDNGQATNISFMDGRAETWTQAQTYEAYYDFFIRLPRVINPKLLLTDNSATYYPWGDSLQ